jgi:hypothetical protein
MGFDKIFDGRMRLSRSLGKGSRGMGFWRMSGEVGNSEDRCEIFDLNCLLLPRITKDIAC